MQQTQPVSGSARAVLRGSWLVAVFWCVTSLYPLQAQMVAAGEQPQAVTEISDNITPQQLRDLVARLSDAEVRELIITQLDKLATATAEESYSEVYIGQLRAGMTIATGALTRRFSSGDHLRRIPASIWQQLADSGRISG